RVTAEQVSTAVNALRGEIELEVPHFSAVKVKGKKLYDYARSGEQVVRPRKVMNFYEVSLIEFDGGCRLKVSTRCSKGSYIRSWVQLLGESLGCGAVAQELRRTASEPFRLENSLG